MDLDQLQLVSDVARQGSFAAVAREHGLDPSSVSRAIASLEDTLGVRLFQRTTRRLSLTEAGATYLRFAEPALDELKRAQEAALSVSAEPRGTLRISASIAFGQAVLVPALERFRTAMPSVALDLVLTDTPLDLVAERIDLAIRLGAAPQGDVVASRLASTRYLVVASADYLARHGPIDTPEALSDHACLRLDLAAYRTSWLFRRAPEAPVTEVPISGPLKISSPLALREAARLGHGPALLADWLVRRDLRDGTLVQLLPDLEAAGSGFDTAAWVIYPSRAFLPQKTRLAIDLLRELVSQPAEAA